MYQIYNIDAQLAQLVDQETGEVLDVEALTSLTIEHDRLVESVALLILELRRQAEAIGGEVKRLQDRKAAIEAKANRLAESLGGYLNHQKFKTDFVTVGFRKSEAVVVEPGAQLTEDLTRTKVEPDKTAIKAALKSGKVIPGCFLEHRISTLVS